MTSAQLLQLDGPVAPGETISLIQVESGMDETHPLTEPTLQALLDRPGEYMLAPATVNARRKMSLHLIKTGITVGPAHLEARRQALAQTGTMSRKESASHLYQAAAAAAQRSPDHHPSRSQTASPPMLTTSTDIPLDAYPGRIKTEVASYDKASVGRQPIKALKASGSPLTPASNTPGAEDDRMNQGIRMLLKTDHRVRQSVKLKKLMDSPGLYTNLVVSENFLARYTNVRKYMQEVGLLDIFGTAPEPATTPSERAEAAKRLAHTNNGPGHAAPLNGPARSLTSSYRSHPTQSASARAEAPTSAAAASAPRHIRDGGGGPPARTVHSEREPSPPPSGPLVTCRFCGEGADTETVFGCGMLHELHHCPRLDGSKPALYHGACAGYSSGVGVLEQDTSKGYPVLLVPETKIEAEMLRGQKLSCSTCRRKGATLGCCQPNCKRTFHYTCARRLAHQGRIMFSNGNRNIACWEHKNVVREAEDEFSGLWMELNGGWNLQYARQADSLSQATVMEIKNNPHLKMQNRIPAKHQSESVLHARVKSERQNHRAPALQSASVNLNDSQDAASLLVSLQGGPVTASSMKRPAQGVMDFLAPTRKAPRSGPRSARATPQGAGSPLPADAMPAQDFLDVEARGSPAVDPESMQQNISPLLPFTCNPAEKAYIAYKLRQLSVPVCSMEENRAALRRNTLLHWLKRSLEDLHEGLLPAVIDVCVTHFGTSIFLERWRVHPDLLAAENNDRSISKPGEVVPIEAHWVQLPELIALLVAFVYSEEADGITSLLADPLPRVFPSRDAERVWRSISDAAATLQRLPPSAFTPQLAALTAKLGGARQRVSTLGRGERITLLGDRGCNSMLLVNMLLQQNLHASGYDGRPAEHDFLACREALGAICEQLSRYTAGVSVVEVEKRPDVDVVSMPSMYVDRYVARAALDQARMHHVLSRPSEASPADAFRSFVLPTPTMAAGASPTSAMRVTVTHGYYPHVLVTYQDQELLQERAHVYLQKAAAEVRAKRLTTLDHFQPSATDLDAIEAKHCYEMLCGNEIQYDSKNSAQPLPPSELQLRREVQSVAGCRRIFQGTGRDVHLDLAWIRDVLALILAVPDADTSDITACLRDHDESMSTTRLRWRRQAAAVCDVKVFVPCALLANGAEIVIAPPTDCALPIETRMMRDCLREATTVLWMLPGEPPSLHSLASGMLSAEFLPYLMKSSSDVTGRRSAAAEAACAANGDGGDAPGVPHLMMPPVRRLVALHWQDLAVHRLPSFLGSVIPGTLTPSSFLAHLGFIEARNCELHDATQAALIELVRMHALSTAADGAQDQPTDQKGVPVKRTVDKAAVADAVNAVIHSQKLVTVIAYPLLAHALEASPELLSNPLMATALAATRRGELMDILDFSSSTRLQAILAATHMELNNALAGRQASMLDKALRDMGGGIAHKVPSLYENALQHAGDLVRSVMAPLHASLCQQLAGYGPLTDVLGKHWAGNTGNRQPGNDAHMVLDSVQSYLVEQRKNCTERCQLWLERGHDASQPRATFKQKGPENAKVHRWIVTPALAGLHQSLPLADLTCYFLHEQNLLDLLACSLDATVKQAVTNAIEQFKEGLVAHIKHVLASAGAQQRFQDMIGRKAVELVDEAAPDLTSLFRVHLLGKAGTGLLSWPGAAAGTNYPVSGAKPSAALSSIFIGTVRRSWQAVLTDHLRKAEGDVPFPTLITSAWMCAEQTALSTSEQIQMRLTEVSAAMLRVARDDLEDSWKHGLDGEEHHAGPLHLLMLLYVSVLGRCQQIISPAQECAADVQAKEEVESVLRTHVAQVEHLQSSLIQALNTQTQCRNRLAKLRVARFSSSSPSLPSLPTLEHIGAQLPTHTSLGSGILHYLLQDVASDEGDSVAAAVVEGAAGGGTVARVPPYPGYASSNCIEAFEVTQPPLPVPEGVTRQRLAECADAFVASFIARRPDQFAPAAPTSTEELQAMLPEQLHQGCSVVSAWPHDPDAPLLALYRAVFDPAVNLPEAGAMRLNACEHLAMLLATGRRAYPSGTASAHAAARGLAAALAAACSSHSVTLRECLHAVRCKDAPSGVLVLAAAADMLRINVVLWVAPGLGQRATRGLLLGSCADENAPVEQYELAYHLLAWPDDASSTELQNFAAILPAGIENPDTTPAPLESFMAPQASGDDVPAGLAAVAASVFQQRPAVSPPSSSGRSGSLTGISNPGVPRFSSASAGDLPPSPGGAPRMRAHASRLRALSLNGNNTTFMPSPHSCKAAVTPRSTNALARLASVADRIQNSSVLTPASFDAFSSGALPSMGGGGASAPMPGALSPGSLSLVLSRPMDHGVAALQHLHGQLQKFQELEYVCVGVPTAALLVLQAEIERLRSTGRGATEACPALAAGRLVQWAAEQGRLCMQTMSQYAVADFELRGDEEVLGHLGAYMMAQQLLSSTEGCRSTSAIVLLPEHSTAGGSTRELAASPVAVGLNSTVLSVELSTPLLTQLQSAPDMKPLLASLRELCCK